MFVIGTAGHIDHGKSTLVKALTGIDPDRLREEKDRGMTIDLGFAWLRLPSGREVSIVDVPGHERFIKNMLAGVGGIDLALLVIAADEGIMPQTAEHLAILEILRVKKAVVALTKCDLVEDDWLELVRADVAERLDRSALHEAAIVPVSSVTGVGVPELLVALDRALDDTPAKPNRGRPRVPIDRVFTIAGFGTVVTGTLIDGPLALGQELEILPGGIKTRARGIQSHKQKVESALPGARVAVNLAGVAVEQVGRGQVLTSANWLRPTTVVDAHVMVLADALPLPHNAQVSFHTGSAEVMARVVLLDDDLIKPGQDGWAQLKFAGPVVVAKGDLFVIRSPNATWGGGEIIDAHPKRHRRRQIELLDHLETLEKGEPSEVVVQSLQGRLGNDLGTASEVTGYSPDQVKLLIDQLITSGEVVGLGDRFLTADAFRDLRQGLLEELEQYHRRFPLRNGAPREELKSRLRLAARDFAALVDRLATETAIVVEESVLRLPSHQVRFSPEQAARVQGFLQELDVSPFAPPAIDELAGRWSLDDEMLTALASRGEMVRVSDNIAFSANAFSDMRGRIVERLQAAGQISVAEVRDTFDTSRKYALALMEYFDQQRMTRRVGDARVLR